MRTLFLSFFIFISQIAASADLSHVFEKIYESDKTLNKEEAAYFAQYDFYLVPGILSEVFIDEDQRSYLDLTFLTGNYFEGEYKTLSKKYKFSTERLSPSSRSVNETKANIRASLEKSVKANRKAVFICHSLGGISLLEEILDNSSYQNDIAGIFFLQSPFFGSPIADIFIGNTNPDSRTLGAILALLNLSHETVEFLSTKHRTDYMLANAAEIEKLTAKIPVITLGGIASGHLSLFKPSIVMIKEDSDGMVPFESSKLLKADFVKLDKADHGELVVRIPFNNFNKERLTVTMLKMLYKIRK